VGRQLLAGDGRHAQPGARPRLEDAGFSQANGQAGADRRVAIPEHQHRLRDQIQRKGRGARLVLGYEGREPPDDHLDARASRLSLSRRQHEQPDRQVQTRQCRPELRPVRPALGEGQMIAGLKNFADRLLGRGDATITVPSFDGALKPNQILEKAETAGQFEAPEDIATDGKTIYIADGVTIRCLDASGASEVRRFDRPITALCCLPDGGIAVALDGREIRVFATPSAENAKVTFTDPSMHAVNALSAGKSGTLVATDGSSTRPAGQWVYDLMERGHSGRVFSLDLASGKARILAAGLNHAFGACATGDAILVSESWRHRVIAVGADGSQRAVLDNLPVYPSRLSPVAGGGFWLTAFIARTQLVEFVLRENAYRRRM